MWALRRYIEDIKRDEHRARFWTVLGGIATLITLPISLVAILISVITADQDQTPSSTIGSVPTSSASPRAITAPVTGAALVATLIDPTDPNELGTDYSASLAFDPSGEILVSALGGRVAKLWNIADLKPGMTPSFLEATFVQALATSPNPTRKILVTAGSHFRDQVAEYGYDTVRLWTIANPPRPGTIATVDHNEETVYAVAFSPDDKVLTTGAADATVKLWDITDPTAPKVITTLSDQKSAVVELAFSPDGDTLAIGSHDEVTLWDVAADRVEAPHYRSRIGHTDAVLALAFSPDSKILATADNDRNFTLWNVADPAAPREIVTLWEGNEPNGLAFSPDGKTLATASLGNAVMLWNVSDPVSPTLITTLSTTNPNRTNVDDASGANAVAFGPDGTILATGSAAGNTVKLWRMER